MKFEDLTPAMMEKARACQTSEKVLALARESGYELSDEELGGIAGGDTDWGCMTNEFCGKGRRFVKDGRTYKLEGRIQSEQARKSGLSYEGKPSEWHLTDGWGLPIPTDQLYQPYFGERCKTCGMQPICNGCSRSVRCS